MFHMLLNNIKDKARNQPMFPKYGRTLCILMLTGETSTFLEAGTSSNYWNNICTWNLFKSILTPVTGETDFKIRISFTSHAVRIDKSKWLLKIKLI